MAFLIIDLPLIDLLLIDLLLIDLLHIKLLIRWLRRIVLFIMPVAEHVARSSAMRRSDVHANADFV